MVNTTTIVDIVQREKKTSKKIITVLAEKIMDTPLNNVTTRKSMGKNARTATQRVMKKSFSRINKDMTKRGKRKRLMSLKRYILSDSECVYMPGFIHMTYLTITIYLNTHLHDKPTLPRG